jgi:hypothetical protein
MLKKGDLVLMTNKGFAYYGNLDKRFHSHQIDGKLSFEHFENLMCDFMAVQGVGEVRDFNTDGAPLIRWRNSVKGIYYFHSFYYEAKDVRKLTFFEKLKYKLLGRI